MAWNMQGICTGLVDEKSAVCTRYMGVMNWVDVHTLHQATCDGDPMSVSTLRRAYDKSWSQVLKFRNIGQHARCTTCSRLSQQRKDAVTEEEHTAVVEAHAIHANKVKADRAVGTRTDMLSVEAAKHPSRDGLNQVLKVSVDGMDQDMFEIMI